MQQRFLVITTSRTGRSLSNVAVLEQGKSRDRVVARNLNFSGIFSFHIEDQEPIGE